MPNTKEEVIPVGISGLNIYVVPRRGVTGLEMNSAGAFVAAPAADPGIVAVEDTTNPGSYNFSSAATEWTNGLHYLHVWERIGATKNRAVDHYWGVLKRSVAGDRIAGVDANIVSVIGDPIQSNSNKNTNWGGTP